jgi:3-hydroxyisobutyrate dehydrogenase-like beta-hydroxyacid dehydrogenase
MGGTLARTLAEAGCELTVWNRTAERAEALARVGCQVAESAAEAVAASPLTVLCLLNDAVVEEVLAVPAKSGSLDGKTIVNLSTGSPAAAEKFGEVVRDAGGSWLDGGILSYPGTIGSDEAVILYSGAPAVFEAHADTLRLLAGAQRHVGSGDGDASSAYLACWVYYYGGLGGFFEAAAYAAAAGIDLQELGTLVPAMSRELTVGVADAVRRVEEGDYSGDQAYVDAHIDGIAGFVETMRAAGVAGDITDTFVRYCRLASERGDGANDIATLVNALKPLRNA